MKRHPANLRLPLLAARAGLLLWAAVLSMDAAAEGAATADRLFPPEANACFATAIRPKGRLNENTDLTSLRLRPRIPATDGDGSFPPDVKAELLDLSPDSIALTLLASFSDDKPAQAFRWGARFDCEPEEGGRERFTCNVADWCVDVSFHLFIESKDGVRIEILPDAGSVGPVGDPCNAQFRRSLSVLSASPVAYQLSRQPERFCR